MTTFMLGYGTTIPKILEIRLSIPKILEIQTIPKILENSVLIYLFRVSIVFTYVGLWDQNNS